MNNNSLYKILGFVLLFFMIGVSIGFIVIPIQADNSGTNTNVETSISSASSAKEIKAEDGEKQAIEGEKTEDGETLEYNAEDGEKQAIEGEKTEDGETLEYTGEPKIIKL